MDADVQAVVDVIVADRTRFVSFVRSLSDEELARPVPESSWIVKDFVSHLATLDAPVRAWFAALHAGRDGAGRGALDVDAFNDAKVAERRDLPIETILAEAARERAALIEVLEQFTAADLTRTVRFNGDNKRPPADIPLGQYVRGWARHDAIHTADMLKALPERRDEPLVAAWLSEPDMAALISGYQRAMA